MRLCLQGNVIQENQLKIREDLAKETELSEEEVDNFSNYSVHPVGLSDHCITKLSYTPFRRVLQSRAEPNSELGT